MVKTRFVDFTRPERFGIFKGTEKDGNKIRVKYLPPSAFKVIVIEDVLPGSLITHNPRKGFGCEEVKILVASEFGDPGFLGGKLGKSTSKLLRIIADEKDSREISRAAVRADRRQLERGKATVLKDVTQQMEQVDKARKKDDEHRRKSTKKFFEE